MDAEAVVSRSRSGIAKVSNAGIYWKVKIKKGIQILNRDTAGGAGQEGWW